MNYDVAVYGVVLVDNKILATVHDINAYGESCGLLGDYCRESMSAIETLEKAGNELTGFNINVGRLLMVHEFTISDYMVRDGVKPILALGFECSTKSHGLPKLANKVNVTDESVIDVKWIPLDDFTYGNANSWRGQFWRKALAIAIGNHPLGYDYSEV